MFSCLFILFAEEISSLFQVAKQNGCFLGIRVSTGCPRVSYLFFADDSVIFGDAIPEQAIEVRRILNSYEVALRKKN